MHYLTSAVHRQFYGKFKKKCLLVFHRKVCFEVSG